MKKIFRHGDLVFEAYKGDDGKELPHTNSFVCAEGETTGHKHLLTVPKVDDMEITQLPTGEYIFSLKTDGTLTHEEHKKIVLPQGKYIMRHEKEFDYFGQSIRKVID